MDQLTPDEIAALVEVLERQLGDLSYEIANTDSQDFRSELKHKRDLLTNALQVLKRHDESADSISSMRDQPQL